MEPPLSPQWKFSWVRRVVTLVLLLMILAIATTVRLAQLGSLRYWFDEAFTIRMSEFPVPEMIVRCAADTHPPLFFFVLKGWIASWGHSEFSARLLSTVWSLLGVGVAFGFTYEALRAGRDRSSHPAIVLLAATTAGLCVALSPLQISWAQQVRMYAAVTGLSLAGTWLLWRAIQNPASWKRWTAYGLVEVAGLYTHVTMLFVFAAHLLALGAILIRGRNNWADTKPLARPALLTIAMVGMIALPWIVVERIQHSRVQEDFWSKPLTLDLLGTAFVKCVTLSQRPVTSPIIGLGIAQGLFLVLLVVAAGRRPFDLLVSLSAGVPIALLIGASIANTNLVNERYFIAGHALLCVAIPVWIARLPSWSLRIPLAATVVASQAYFTWDYHLWRSQMAGRPGIPELLATWQEHREADEPLVFCNPMFSTVARMYQDPADLRIFGQEDDYPFFVGTAITSDEEYLSSAEIDSGRWQKIWVCDHGNRERYLNPVEMSDAWRLVTEKGVSDYSGAYYLRSYERSEQRKISDH